VSKSLTYFMGFRFARTHRHREEALCHIVNLRVLYVHLNLYSYCTVVRTSDVSCKFSIIFYLPQQLEPRTSYSDSLDAPGWNP